MTVAISDKLRGFFKNWQARLRLTRRLSRKTPRQGWQRRRIKVVLREGSSRLVEIWKYPRVTVRLRLSAFPDGTYEDRLRVAIYAFVLTKPSVKSATISVDDVGGEITNQITFSSNAAGALLIPDSDFFNNNAYQQFRGEIHRQRPWNERNDTIMWRGSTTGIGRIPDDIQDYTAPDALPRLRLCALLKPLPDIDARIYQCVQAPDPVGLEAQLRAAGLFASYRQPHEWLDRKFAIDIDGNANAWSNLFTRLLMGCCVIKVSSPRHYRQWYYDRLEPWKNFVPVRADLTDLTEKIEWCRTHENECAQIAAAGQEMARAMTLDVEMQDAVRRLNERLG
ncbi:MAG: glycosyl transferase family 90 [Pseudolabrys sp.]